MALKILLGVWISAVIVAAFLFTPPGSAGFREPESARIIIFHVPCAIMAALGFLVCMLYGVKFLRTRSLSDDAKSAVSAELGLVFTVLATFTGALFAQRQWGVLWNWDTREISIVLLMIVYVAYFGLRSAVDSAEKRASLSAVYAILAVVPMVFLIFVLPRMVFSLHPASTGGYPAAQRIVMRAAMIGFAGLFIWLFQIRMTVAEAMLKLRRY